MLGYVTTPVGQSTNSISSTTTLGTISIPIAGVYILTILGSIRLSVGSAQVALMAVPVITASLVFSGLGGDAAGYYQTAGITVAISVGANYTYSVVASINPVSVPNVSQGYLNYSYMRIA
jgi:hypothetical protein